MGKSATHAVGEITAIERLQHHWCIFKHHWCIFSNPGAAGNLYILYIRIYIYIYVQMRRKSTASGSQTWRCWSMPHLVLWLSNKKRCPASHVWWHLTILLLILHDDSLYSPYTTIFAGEIHQNFRISIRCWRAGLAKRRVSILWAWRMPCRSTGCEKQSLGSWDMNGIFKEYWNDWNVNGTSLKNGALNGKIRVLLLCFILYTWWFNWCGNGIVMGYSRSSNGILMRYSWDAESFTFWHVDCHVHVQCIWRERKRERERETESDKRTLRERERRGY